MILGGICVVEGLVADDTEGDEGYLIDITGLGNSARLHIDSLGLREEVDDAAHLLLRIYEPVAGDYQALMNLYPFNAQF